MVNLAFSFSLSPCMTLHNASNRPQSSSSSRRPPAHRLVQRLDVAIRNDHLGVALSLLSDNPCLRLPNTLAEELAAKLRIRGVHDLSEYVGRAFRDSNTSTFQLLANERKCDDLMAIASSGKLNRVVSILRNSPPGYVNTKILEKILRAAASGGNVRNAARVLYHVFSEFDLVPTATAYGDFVSTCGKAGQLGKATEATQSLKFSMLSKEEQTYVFVKLVDAHVRCNQLDEAEKIVFLMKRRNVPRTKEVYVSLLTGAARTRPIDKSLKIVTEMIKDGFSVDSVDTYNALMLGSARAGRLHEALQLYDNIKHSNVAKPNLDTYNALFSCCAKASKPQKAFEILKEMKEISKIRPNAVSYNSIVVACARVSDVDRAFQVARRMRLEGIRLNIVTYNNLLEACCNAGRLERAFTLVKHMIQEQRISPNSHTYNTLIRGCGRWGQLDAAFRLLTSMRQAGVSPTIVTYTVAVDACARAGGSTAVDQAFELVEEMRESGLEPNIVTYNSLTHACARARRADLAERVLREMTSKGITPDIVTLCSLVDAYGRSGKIEEAFKIIRKLPQSFSSLQVNTPAYNALIHACLKAGDLEKMEVACREMISLNLRPNIFTFSTLISAYATGGDVCKAKSLFIEMKQSGLSPNKMIFTSMISGYGLHRKVDKAMEMLEAAKNSFGEPDEELYTVAIIAAIRGGRKELAVKLAKEMSRAGYFVPTVLNRMMRKTGDVEKTAADIQDVLGAMEALNIRPQRAGLESLIAAYAKEGNTDGAFSLLPNMEALGYPPNLQTYKKLIQACECSGTHEDLEKAQNLFNQLRSKLKSDDARLRSHHWRELYEATIRAVDKINPSRTARALQLDLLNRMSEDCDEEHARALAARLCPDLLPKISKFN